MRITKGQFDLVKLRQRAKLGLTAAAAKLTTADQAYQAIQITRWETHQTLPAATTLAHYLRLLSIEVAERSTLLLQPADLIGKWLGEINADVFEHKGGYNLAYLLQLEEVLGDEAGFWAEYEYEEPEELEVFAVTPAQAMKRARLKVVDLAYLAKQLAPQLATDDIPQEEFTKIDPKVITRSFNGVPDYAGGDKVQLTDKLRKALRPKLHAHLKALNRQRETELLDINMALAQGQNEATTTRLSDRKDFLLSDQLPWTPDYLDAQVNLFLSQEPKAPTTRVTMEDEARFFIRANLTAKNHTAITAALLITLGIASRTPMDHLYRAVLHGNQVAKQMQDKEAQKLCTWMQETLGYSYPLYWARWLESKPPKLCRTCMGTRVIADNKPCPKCGDDYED